MRCYLKVDFMIEIYCKNCKLNLFKNALNCLRYVLKSNLQPQNFFEISQTSSYTKILGKLPVEHNFPTTSNKLIYESPLSGLLGSFITKPFALSSTVSVQFSGYSWMMFTLSVNIRPAATSRLNDNSVQQSKGTFNCHRLQVNLCTFYVIKNLNFRQHFFSKKSSQKFSIMIINCNAFYALEKSSR